MDASDFGLILRPYQKETAEKINEIYNNTETEYNRFAGAVLPTGGGKSFIAIDQMISINNDHGQSSDLDKGIVNNSKITYIAPGKEILSQIKMHIVRNVVLNMLGDLDRMTINEINQSMQGMFDRINNESKKSSRKIKFKPITEIDDTASVNEKKNAIITNLNSNQIDKLVQMAFPNLTLKCYAGIKEIDEGTITTEGNEEGKEKYDREPEAKLKVKESDIANSDLIIVDEAHRLGAKSWGSEISAAISNNKKAKVLAITATPERVDKKGKRDMMYGIAKMVYPDNVPLEEEYMAQEIYLLDAMRDGLVTPVEVVDFSSSLAQSDEYWNLVEILERLEKDGISGTRKDEISNALKEMEEIIGYSPRDEKEKLEEIRQADIIQTLKENLENKNGKYIAFIPNRKFLGKKNSKDNFEAWEGIIRSQLEGIVDPSLITIKFVSSDKKSENAEVLKWFEDAPNDKGGIKILMAVDMLDEGVHVEGIDGEFMYKKVKSSRVYLQESGRCISSCDPNLPSDQQSHRKIFDIVGNTRTQIDQRTGKKISHQYNLRKIAEISDWIELNGRYPDINKQIPENATDEEKIVIEKEIRYAIILKNLKARYKMYKTEDLPIESKAIIEKIMKIGNDIKLWELEIQDRIYEPSEAKLTGSEFLSYSEKEARFMELYHKAKSYGIYDELYNKDRFARAVNILRILKMHKQDLKFPEGIFFEKVSEYGSKSTKTLRETGTVDFETFLSENFDDAEVQRIIRELGDYDLLNASSCNELYYKGEKLDFAKELAFARGYFWTSGVMLDKNKEERSFSRYTLKDLISVGLIDVKSSKQIEDVLEMFGVDLNEIFDDKGFIKPMDECIVRTASTSGKFGISSRFKRGSFTHEGKEYVDGYDRDGYDIEGYDIEGYDKFGFNKRKFHRDTGTRYNIRGFYWNEENQEWLNKETGTEYDLLGYNIYDKNKGGFERPGKPPGNVKALWYERYPDGTYSETGKKYSEITKVTSTGHNEDDVKYNRKVGKFYPNGVTFDSTYVEKLTIDDYFNSEGLDVNGYNKEGFKEVIVNGEKKYIHRDTSREFNKEGMIYKDGKLKLQSSLHNARLVLRLMLVENKNINEVGECLKRLSPKFKNKTQDEMKDEIRKILQNGINVSRYAENFDLYMDSRTGQSLFKDIQLYPEKIERVQEIFLICPLAKKTIINESNELNRRFNVSRDVKISRRQRNVIEHVSELGDILEEK